MNVGRCELAAVVRFDPTEIQGSGDFGQFVETSFFHRLGDNPTEFRVPIRRQLRPSGNRLWN